jgi:hypothetical protein
MSNKTNEHNWAVRERLRFIETCAWWKGTVNRHDLTGLYGVSMAQASSDMQRYLDLNPSALVYNLRLKRYEATATMKCVVSRPLLEDAVARFMDGGFQSFWPGSPPVESGDGSVAMVLMPAREANEIVQRRAFLAIMNGQRIRMRYASVRSGKEDWRWIRPHALGHNGARWHLRAWCEKNDAFRDFTLSRISEIEWSREQAGLPRPDLEWEEWVTLRVRANRSLDKSRRQAVELDYGMTSGVLELRVRKAMEGYLRDRLGLPMADGSAPAALLECVK